MEIPGIIEVVIVSRPSQLSPTTRANQMKAARKKRAGDRSRPAPPHVLVTLSLSEERLDLSSSSKGLNEAKHLFSQRHSWHLSPPSCDRIGV